ncbi:MAG: HAD family phosphatase [Treponema sp.]|jgi:putative hydrolase of the HAD superfamily|nr:HAD family phosphatase [Treponema sp.]
MKAVVFDFGRVICFPPSAENREALCALTGLSAGVLEELDRKHRGAYDRGACNGPAYYRTLLGDAGLYPDEAALETMAETDAEGWKRLDPAALALMRDVKKAGFALGVLSNMPYDFLDWARTGIPLFAELDAAVFSCEVNTIKPERRIYEILRDRLGCEFGEIVFFDDVPVNVEKAAELGIRAFLWKGAPAARETLGKLGGAFG